MSKELDNYIDWMRVNGLSEASIDTYDSRMVCYEKFHGSLDISEDKIMSFLSNKQKEGCSANTINSYNRALTSFCRYKGIEVKFPKHQKVPKTLPKYITEEEFTNEIIPAVDYLFLNAIRVKAILYFMFYTGVRRGELCSIKRASIDLINRKAKVYSTKNHTEKEVFFPDRVTKILDAYFSIESEETNAFNVSRAGINYIFKTIKPNFKRLTLHPHLFRHSYAVHLIMNGVDISVVSKLLGHSDIKTTMIYAQLNNKHIEEVYRKAVGK